VEDDAGAETLVEVSRLLNNKSAMLALLRFGYPRGAHVVWLGCEIDSELKDTAIL
jgi:hypothetical protein